MSRRWFTNSRLLLAIYFMALTGAILHAYPGIFQDLQRMGPVPPESPLKTLPPTYFSASAAGSEKFEASPPTSIYRQNIQRTGADTENSVSPELKLAWAYRPFNVGIHTASKASPAVDSTGIYIGTDDAWFYAFDHEGQVRWRFHVSGASRGIHGTASLDENRVYFGAYNGSLYCLDKKTGALIWTVQLGVALGASPVLSGDFVYAGVELMKPLDGFVAKVNRADGRVIWASPSMGEQTHSSPTLNAAAELVYSGANNGRFFAYEILTGKIRWSIDLGDAVKSTSALVNNILYISSWSKTLTAVNPLTGETLWQSKLEGKARSSPSFVPGLNILIIEDEAGHVYGFSATSGKTTLDLRFKN